MSSNSLKTDLDFYFYFSQLQDEMSSNWIQTPTTANLFYQLSVEREK